ncbi:MAG: hypothetical protein N2201_06785 [candidate division WOR-3 bacterium]|nr:hypothetical protein [candidate division WOR-3 bacterium]
MRLFFSILFIYILFLIQVSFGQFPLDLTILGLVIFSLYDTAVSSLILGIWTGILWGLINPIYFGFPIIITTIIAYACNSIHRFIYKQRVYLIGIVLVVLIFKYLIGLIFTHSQIRFTNWLLSVIVLIAIALPLEILITKLFYR